MTHEEIYGELLQAIARAWCTKDNEHKEMDPDLAVAIAEEVWGWAVSIWSAPITMCSDEAIAVYLYLKHRPTGSRTKAEEVAFSTAWAIICKLAEQTINQQSTEKS